MFFSISSQIKLNFPNHLKVDDFCISFDNGWHQRETKNNILLYKGYLDEHNIDNAVHEVLVSHQPKYLGNFCVINFEKNSKNIETFVVDNVISVGADSCSRL